MTGRGTVRKKVHPIASMNLHCAAVNREPGYLRRRGSFGFVDAGLEEGRDGDEQLHFLPTIGWAVGTVKMVLITQREKL
jgi:hypothetical protein